MLAFEAEIADITRQIGERFNPEQVYLFGSCAKGWAHSRSDIDLCIIMPTRDKRVLVRDMLLELNYERDVDIVVYTPEEWSKHSQDPSTFANVIRRTGVKLRG
ncbi:Nucleotidyltransferase domain protein [Acididesulfobacillus acetoxydans]|uniref:GrpB/Dephospho-CoA kinase n=2 Tax=Acididesulfobacillus acetoxydans TaxID=1561005 RepID=A0A8S0WMA4_9FIRM|nr:Nucleotidyltransferase domain protein [Acididesulfobacillus acetoxydans]CEJ06628.1 GrpB/Dephospho-CoA kinase [Acididesulfobacillus acetoxydans]